MARVTRERGHEDDRQNSSTSDYKLSIVYMVMVPLCLHSGTDVCVGTSPSSQHSLQQSVFILEKSEARGTVH